MRRLFFTVPHPNSSFISASNEPDNREESSSRSEEAANSNNEWFESETDLTDFHFDVTQSGPRIPIPVSVLKICQLIWSKI